MKRVVLPMLLLFSAPAVARGFVIDPTLPVKHSPCVWDIDASWMQNATRGWKTSKTTIEHAFSCDGAVPLAVSVEKQGDTKWFWFTVGLRSGHDRDGLIQFSLVDASGKTVAYGEAKDNLDEGQESYLLGALKIKSKDLAQLLTGGNKTVLHIALSVDKPE